MLHMTLGALADYHKVTPYTHKVSCTIAIHDLRAEKKRNEKQVKLEDGRKRKMRHRGNRVG